MSGTRLNYSIFAGGYVLPTTGLATEGDDIFRENDKVVVDKDLNTKEENYVKYVQDDKILLNSPLKYNHDWHANIENRFQGLNEFSDYADPNATVLNIPRTRRISFSNIDTDTNCVLVDGNDEAGRTLVHQTSNGSADYEEIWLWAYNDSDKALDLTIEFGGMSNSVEVGAPIAFNSRDVLKVKVPSRSGLFQIFTGQVLQNSLRVTAFSEEANKITLHGYVNKIEQRNLNSPTEESPILVTDSVIGWGENFYGQASVPNYLVSSKKRSVKSLSAGYNSSFAVLGDDRVIGWGSDMHKQLSNIPTMFSPSAGTTTTVKVDKIAVGARHALALYEDHNQNTYVTSWGAHDENSVPISMGNVKDISAGSEHNLALLDDGTVFGWGKNIDGQAKGVASTDNAWGAQGGVVSGNNGVILDDVVGISAGSSHNIALRKDSTVVCWGSNWGGQSLPPADLTDVIQISAGLNHSLALKEDGQVVAWGNDKFGQSTVPAGLTVANAEIESVEAAGNSSMALKKDGSIIHWGASIALDRKLKNEPKYKIKSIYGGLEHAISTDAGLPHDGVAVRADSNGVAAPISFTHSLQGEYDDINIIKYNSGASTAGGSILTTYFKHGLFTGNKVRIGTSATLYYVRNEGDYQISLHHTAANASTGQARLNGVGVPGEDIFIMATSSVSRKVVSAENSLIKTNLDHKFSIGDKVKFELSSWNKAQTIYVKIINGGDNLKTAPTLDIAAPAAGLAADVKATAIALLDISGSIRKVIVTNPGKGYISEPAVTLGNLNFSVKSVDVTNPGSGYATAPNIEFIGGGGSGATAVAVLDGMTGAWTIESITLIEGGEGYSSVPIVKITGGGVDRVYSLALTSTGSGYTAAPTITLVGGGGNGATATCSITDTVTDQWGQTTTVDRDYITSIALTNAGSGYSHAPTVSFTGGGAGTIQHATGFTELEGVNTAGTQAAATAIISSSTVNLKAILGGSLGTLANELVDEIDLNAVYFAHTLGNKGLTLHRTREDALNGVSSLDFGIDNIFSQLAIVKLLNDPLQTTTSDKPVVSQTVLSQDVTQGSVSLAVENSNGFESGKQIIIDENDCEEERATILRATSSYLILTTGTKYAHEKNKTIKLVLAND